MLRQRLTYCPAVRAVLTSFTHTKMFAFYGVLAQICQVIAYLYSELFTHCSLHNLIFQN